MIAVNELSATTNSSGVVDIPVTFSKSDLAGGLNYIVAVIKAGDGTTSPISETSILEYSP